MEPLIGRDRELQDLRAWFETVRAGRCSVLLLTGEAGVGKTALARSAAFASGVEPFEGFGIQDGTPPYNPIVAVLRALGWPAGRSRLDGLADPVRSHLAVLLPELGEPAGAVDRAELVEAVRSVFAIAASRGPLLVFLDDLQWADHATFELLPTLTRSLGAAPVGIMGAYRSDEIARDHPLRRSRTDLRRAGRLVEVAVRPLDPADTASLVTRELGAAPSAALADAIFDRTDGVPFFVEQLAASLAARGRVRPGPSGLELDGDDLPLPESVRDAVLVRAATLSHEATAALAVAAVIGLTFDPTFAAAICDLDEWPEDLADRGLVTEAEPGRMAFRHSLIREAFYGDVPRTRRAALHRAIAARLEADGAPPATVAEHWAKGRDPERARHAFIDALVTFRNVHAYRDGMWAARRALDLWPDEGGPAGGAASKAPIESEARLHVLELLGACAELAGDLGEAASTWRDVAEVRRQGDDPLRRGAACRRLATVLELQGRWEDGLAAREEGAAAFDAAGARAEAAAERLASAAHLRSAARFHAALEQLVLAEDDARQAGRLDLEVRIRGLEGNVRARMGEADEGVSMTRLALTTALEANLSDAAAEVYQRLADSLEHAGDYPSARATYDAAFSFCSVNALVPTAQLCLACLTVVLRQTGEWDRATTVCNQVLASADSSAHARSVASGTLGLIACVRGQVRRARPLLLESASLARRIELAAMELLSGWGLALLDDADGAPDRALERCRTIRSRWAETEERHYAVSPLRWATTRFAEGGDSDEARACAAALSQIATDSPRQEAMSALSHAIGEMSLLEGDAEAAALHFGRAVDLLRTVGAPLERIDSNRRAADALALAGRADDAVSRYMAAYRIARRLRAAGLAGAIRTRLEGLGERPDRRRSTRGGTSSRGGELTRREAEVLRLVALGWTSREIAQDLFLSPRTVEMHVQNILTKLDCRSRADAVRRGVELGLLQPRDEQPA